MQQRGKKQQQHPANMRRVVDCNPHLCKVSSIPSVDHSTDDEACSRCCSRWFLVVLCVYAHPIPLQPPIVSFSVKSSLTCTLCSFVDFRLSEEANMDLR